MTRTFITSLLTTIVATVALVVFAADASAQTGTLRGTVTGADGKPVEGATISITSKATNSTRQVTTNKNGEYIQIGLFPGEYTITAEKDDMKFVAENFRVGIGDHPLDMTLQKGAPSEEQQAENAALQKLYDEGIAASKAGNFDDSIAKFNEAIAILPECQGCYYYIGQAHAGKKEWDEAEAAYKKALGIKPDYAPAWSGLTNLYNAQGKNDLALEAAQKAEQYGGGGAAGGGGSASALYNQGVIFWNQNNFAEAAKRFEAATTADPNYAMAYYRLGMARLNLGDTEGAVTAFEGYMTAAPDGPQAAEVKGILEQLKQ